MKNTWGIKQWINQLIQEQTKQQETLVHITCILNITHDTTQKNRQKLNEVMDALQKVKENVNTIFNIPDVLTQHLRYQQIYTSSHTILAYLRDPLMYMRQVPIHTMDYIDAVMTNILSPNMLLVEELRKMFWHIESQPPLTIHLPISSDNTLHFFQYLKTQILIVDGQILLLIYMAIQDRKQQCQIYEIFNLPVQQSDRSDQYKINNK